MWDPLKSTNNTPSNQGLKYFLKNNKQTIDTQNNEQKHNKSIVTKSSHYVNFLLSKIQT